MILSVFLGIDIGTTAIKLGLIKENELLYSSELLLQTYGDDRIKYQDGNELLAILQAGLLAIPIELRQQVRTISFSTAMHSLMPDDGRKQIFLWSDLLAATSIDRFKQMDLAAHFYKLSGTPIHAMSTFAKLLYFQENEIYPAGIHWYGIKELLMEYFTGETVIDYATASATGLFDLREKQWSEEILEFLGVKPDQLASLVDTDQCFEMLPDKRDLFGFTPDVKVVVGASDGTLAAYASYYSTGRTASLTIGTSAAVRQITKRIQLDQKKQNFCYYLKEGLLVSGAPSNNGGVVLAWAANHLTENPARFYKRLPKLLSETETGANGLRFWPYLNGERAPYWSNEIKGGFYDLTLQHTRNDMLRSVIEGVLLNIRRLVELVAKGEELSVSGGFFQTTELGQLAADVFGVKCCYAQQNEPIFGLYYLLEQPELMIEESQQVFLPDLSNHAAYDQIAENYFD
ncbi:FGGY family carbohydrate kinase [Enterococcus hulanensis]|uniref:FGGY family carbohydrate kinase n=1 Tax=Enterococcus hulanensis TaxID=2559929 RepID=A0ABU3F4X1_9ENTE|nr:FGGY family carbohydrate kinase [Enterococcus hulanensis]MDT2602187.1 FGGY family carbohydrate kinase [Enterococcus hulanensis]